MRGIARAPLPQRIQLCGVCALWPVAGTWLSRDRDDATNDFLSWFAMARAPLLMLSKALDQREVENGT